MAVKDIWVLYGGNSSEREVSLNSGKQIEASLKRSGFVTQLFDVSPGASLTSLDWSNPPDMVFLGLHGSFGEDGKIQGFLESYGIPYVGSNSFSSAICFDKIATKLLLHSTGIPCIPSFHLFSPNDLESFLSSSQVQSELQTKRYFVKASRQGSTLGAFRYDPKEFKNPLDGFREICLKAFEFDSRVLVEEWVVGRELTVALFKGKALPIVEIIPDSQFYDYEHKYTKGRTQYISPAKIDDVTTEKIKHFAERAYVILENKDYARIDFLLTDSGDFFVLEMNTLPGMTETSLVPKAAQAFGISYDEFLRDLVDYSEKRQRSG